MSGLPVAVASFLGVIYLQFLVVAMSLLTDSPEQLGYFVASTRVVQAFVGLPFLLVTVVLPVLTLAARDDQSRLNYVTAKMTETMTIAGTGLALFLVLAADPVIAIVGGSAYAPAADVLRVQASASLTIFVVAAWIPTMIGLDRGREFAIAVGAGLIALLASSLFLIPAYEATGGAGAAVVGDLVYALAMALFLWRAGPGRELPGFRLLAIVVIGAILVAFGLLVVGPSLASAVGLTVVFAAALFLFRLVPGEFLSAGAGAAGAARAAVKGRAGGRGA